MRKGPRGVRVEWAAVLDMGSKMTRGIYWLAIAVICLAWFVDSLAWYVAVPLILLFLVQAVPPAKKSAAPLLPSELPATFRFTYVDRDGDPSERTVDVRHISQKDDATYLEGFCHKRSADRTFRTDRILGRLMNVETGEVIDAEDLLLSVRERSAMTFMPGVKSDDAKWQTAVLFVGFSESEQDELEELATDAGWDVRAAVSPSLDYLVTGPLAVRSKVSNAKELGVRVIDKDLFRTLV